MVTFLPYMPCILATGKGMESRMEGMGQSLRGGAMGGIWGAGTILLICVHLFIYVLPQ